MAEQGCMIESKSPMAVVLTYCLDRLYTRSVFDTTAPLQLQLQLLALYKCYAFACTFNCWLEKPLPLLIYFLFIYLILLTYLLCLFQQIYRKKPGMTMDASRLAENLPKNRYRDISPCGYSMSVLVS